MAKKKKLLQKYFLILIPAILILLLLLHSSLTASNPTELTSGRAEINTGPSQCAATGHTLKPAVAQIVVG